MAPPHHQLEERIKNVISSARQTSEVRRAAKQELQLLEREVAGYSSEADRHDLEAILDRYPDEDTAAMRKIIVRQQI
jgi:hypothetical protein